MTDLNISSMPEDQKDSASVEYPDLKALREAKGLVLRDIYERTRISVVNLEAIEKGQFHLLPAPAYARPFIRSYASAIGVDGKIILDAYERHLQTLSDRIGQVKEAGGVRRKIEKRYKRVIWLLSAAVAAIILIFVLARFSQPVPETVPDQSASSVQQAPDAKPAETSSATARPQAPPEAAPERDKTAQADPVPQAAQSRETLREKVPLPQAETSSATARPQEPPKAIPDRDKTVQADPVLQAVQSREAFRKKVPATPVENDPVKSVQPEMPKPATEKNYHLFMEARETVWLRIREDRHPSEQMILKPGETLDRFASESFTVDIGNAGGIEIVFQGKPVGNIGKSGQVVHLRFP